MLYHLGKHILNTKRKMETCRRLALSIVIFFVLRIALGVPLERSSRATSANAYNQLVGSLAAGTSALLMVMVSMCSYKRVHVQMNASIPA